MELSVEHVRRVTIRLRDRERPVIAVRRTQMAVAMITLEASEADDQITGTVTVHGHWANGASRKPVSIQTSPAAAMRGPLAPFIANMLAAR